MRLHPVDETRKHLLDLPLVADEVVINNEHTVSPPQIVDCFQFLNQLIRILHPGSAAIEGSDVTEFAIERTAPRALNH